VIVNVRIATGELGGLLVDIDPADRAAVDAPPYRLEVFDRCMTPRLWRAG